MRTIQEMIGRYVALNRCSEQWARAKFGIPTGDVEVAAYFLARKYREWGITKTDREIYVEAEWGLLVARRLGHLPIGAESQKAA